VTDVDIRRLRPEGLHGIWFARATPDFIFCYRNVRSARFIGWSRVDGHAAPGPTSGKVAGLFNCDAPLLDCYSFATLFLMIFSEKVIIN
jgi:hypothetical protein